MSEAAERPSVLYYGDNLPILRNRDYFPSESIDLVYLDPPFKSDEDYNVRTCSASSVVLTSADG